MVVGKWRQLYSNNNKKNFKNDKKEEILTFVTAWIDLENIMLSESRHSVKD